MLPSFLSDRESENESARHHVTPQACLAVPTQRFVLIFIYFLLLDRNAVLPLSHLNKNTTLSLKSSP